jgi:hypothetical protein
VAKSNVAYKPTAERLAEIEAEEQRDAKFERAILRILTEARGGRFTNRQLFERMGFDPVQAENWQRVCTVIWWLHKLHDIGRIKSEQQGVETLWFIPPPKEEAEDATRA